MLSGKETDVLLAEARGNSRESNLPSVTFLRSEWATIIDARGIESWEDYRAVSRAGRAVAAALERADQPVVRG